MEGMDLIPLESNLHKYHPVIISQIINMIKSDNFWHHKTFESVMSNLWNMWLEGIQELENAHMHCTNNDKNNNEMDGVEVINLCSVCRSKNDAVSEGKERAKQESQDISKHDEMDKIKAKLKTTRSESTIKKDIVESATMCWELTGNFVKEEPHEEPEKVTKKPIEKTDKQKHEEEHVGPTLDEGSPNEVCLSTKDAASTVGCNSVLHVGKRSAGNVSLPLCSLTIWYYRYALTLLIAEPNPAYARHPELNTSLGTTTRNHDLEPTKSIRSP